MKENDWSGQYYFFYEEMMFRLEPEWQGSQQCKTLGDETSGRRKNKYEKNSAVGATLAW